MASPIKFAHVVFRTGRFQEMLSWWQTVLEAEAHFENEFIAFLSYDDEHHRIALINAPLEDPEPGRAGIDHIAYTYASFDDLFDTYTRLGAEGIEPYWTIHHGGTLSAYYRDPDGNQVELQIDAMSPEAIDEFVRSGAFAANPIGIDVSFDDLIARRASGESAESLLAYPAQTDA